MDILLKIYEEDISFVESIIKNLIVKTCENPLLKQTTENINFLKNIANVFNNIEELIGVNPEIIMLIMQSINILASKNSLEIRTLMKNLNLFELRETFLTQILKFEIKSDRFHKILEGFSFENLCNQNKFKESNSLASILKLLLEQKDNLSLQVY